MLKQLFLFAGMLVLAGCGPTEVTLPWRAGASAGQADFINTSCNVYALQQVPRALSTTVTPVTRTPSNVVCNQVGDQTFCHDYGGQTFGGYSVTEDLNEDLRMRVHAQCLAAEGYQLVTMPICTAEQAKHLVISDTLPPAGQVLCVDQRGYVPR